MTPTRSRLVGYIYPDGCPVCVDCDVYPSGVADLREGDHRLTDLECSMCGRPMSEVQPLAGKVADS